MFAGPNLSDTTGLRGNRGAGRLAFSGHPALLLMHDHQRCMQEPGFRQLIEHELC
jgi:hypothetical protein